MSTNCYLIFVVASFLFSSCVRNQYATLSSTMEKTNIYQYYSKNDTMSIYYSFSGKNCPIKITIHNNLTIPLYVDWKKSSLTIHGQSYPYWNDKTTLDATVKGYEVHWMPLITSTQSSVTGSLSREESISFIPPDSYIQKSFIEIKDIKFNLNRSEGFKEIINTSNGKTSTLQYNFTKENSPLPLKSFVTISTTPSFEEPLVIKNEFWVSNVMETLASPSMIAGKNPEENKFYLSQATGAGTFLAVCGVLVAGILLSMP